MECGLLSLLSIVSPPTTLHNYHPFIGTFQTIEGRDHFICRCPFDRRQKLRSLTF